MTFFLDLLLLLHLLKPKPKGISHVPHRPPLPYPWIGFR